MIGRIVEVGKPAFQLRKGEQGLSIFDLEVVDPPLTEVEVLASFRPGSQVILRSGAEIVAKGLELAVVVGDEGLPERLRQAHREIRPAAGITRAEFKRRLQELE